MFTTLVLSGANTHGVMYAGCVRYLVERGWHKGITTVIGSSSGALIGFMFALGLSPDQIDKVILNVFCHIGIPCVSVTRLFGAWSSLGILGSEWKKEYLRNVLKNELALNDVSFSDFVELTGKNLVVVGSNVTTHKAEYFSKETTPTMSIIEALDITTCIPFVMKPISYKGSLYVDGGVYNYLPTNLVCPTERNTTLVLYSPLPERSPLPTNMFGFIREVIFSLVYMKYHENSTRFPYSIGLVTNESAASVDTVTFKQKIIVFPPAMIERMLKQGYDQTKEYLHENFCATNNDGAGGKDKGKDSSEAKAQGKCEARQAQGSCEAQDAQGKCQAQGTCEARDNQSQEQDN